MARVTLDVVAYDRSGDKGVVEIYPMGSALLRLQLDASNELIEQARRQQEKLLAGRGTPGTT
jgi:hypothetical protein